MGVSLKIGGFWLFCAAALAGEETLYRIHAFAGTDFSGDGEPAVQAPLIQPQGLLVDRDGTIVFADAGDHRVRRILPNGAITTIAGDGLAGSGERLRNPYGVALGPKREIYVADLGNGRVLRIDPDGKRHEIKGFQQPRNVAVDANGVVYVSDFGANRVYRVKPDDTLELATTETFKGPAGLLVDPSGSLYVADSGNQRVVRLRSGSTQVLLSDFGAVTSIALDGGGRLYAAGGDRVAVVSPSGAVTLLQSPAEEVGVDLYGSLLTVAYRQIRAFRFGAITILAGNGFGAYAGDGKAEEHWRFLRPSAVARDQRGTLYIADSGNGRVRAIDSEGKMSSLMEALGTPTAFALDSRDRLYFSDSKSGAVYRIEADGTSKVFTRGSGTKPFLRPAGLAFNAKDDLYVADTGNGMLRKVSSDGFVSIVAGGGSSDKDGFAMSVRLTSPTGVALSRDGSVWFTEPERLRRLHPDGRITTVPDLPLIDARAVRFQDETHLLIADAGAHRILRVAIDDGSWEPIAGSGERGYSGDESMALQATLDGPLDMWPEADGSILVSDTGNNRIRQLSVGKDDEPGVPPPAGNSPIRVRHAATGNQEAVAPGQLIFVDSEEPFASSDLRVLFGKASAKVLAVNTNRVLAVVPESVPVGTAEMIVGPWITPVQIVPSAPAFTAPVLNADESQNSVERPASRTGSVIVRLTGEGAASDADIQAEITGIGLPVISAERVDGERVVLLQLPGGFLPSGSSTLDVWVNGVKVAGTTRVVIQ